MPTELCHIIFKPTEVVGAILAHRRALKQPVPVGQIVDFGTKEVPTGAPLAFALRIQPDRSGQTPFDLKMEGAELITALLALCRERKIPVAMCGGKTFTAFGRRVGLVVALGAAEERQDLASALKKIASAS